MGKRSVLWCWTSEATKFVDVLNGLKKTYPEVESVFVESSVFDERRSLINVEVTPSGILERVTSNPLYSKHVFEASNLYWFFARDRYKVTEALEGKAIAPNAYRISPVAGNTEKYFIASSRNFDLEKIFSGPSFKNLVFHN